MLTDEQFQVGYPIPEFTNVKWEGRKPVRHFVIKADMSKAKMLGGIYLYKEDHTDAGMTAHLEDEMAPHIKTVMGGTAGPTRLKEILLFKVLMQSWVILELDREDDWRFSTSHPAVTTKTADKPMDGQDGLRLHGFNANLRYVTEKGEIRRFEELRRGDICKIVFFRVVAREERKGRGMNFLVDLFHADASGEHRIPIIIDPDMPDDGNSAFP